MLDDVLQCFVYKQYNSDQLVMQVHEKNFPTVIVNLYSRLGVNDVSDMFIHIKKNVNFLSIAFCITLGHTWGVYFCGL